MVQQVLDSLFNLFNSACFLSACAVFEIPQPTMKQFTLCKENSVVCKALHKYVLLKYHELHNYCLYVCLAHFLQNLPPYLTGNGQLQQEHAQKALLSKRRG